MEHLTFLFLGIIITLRSATFLSALCVPQKDSVVMAVEDA